MPPVKEPIKTEPTAIPTSAGMETVDQTVARAKAMVAPKTDGQAAKERIAAARAARNNTTITPDAMAPEPAFNLTPPAPAVQAPALAGTLEAETDAFTQNLEAQKKATETGKGTALEQYIAGLQNRQGLAGFTTQLEDQMGFAGIEDELNDINQQIREEQLAMRRATERVLAQGGQSKGQAQTMINNLERDSLARQADLSIIQLGKQAKYDSALARIDRKAKALFEQEQNVLDALKFNYQENKDLFTTAEQRLFETRLGDRERKLQEDIDNRKAIDELALDALINGAPTDVVTRMQQAQTKADAIATGGQFVGRLDRLAKESSIRASNASAALNEAELTAFNNAQQDAAAGILNGEQVGIAQTINKDFESEPIVQSYNAGLQKYIVLEDTLANGIDGIQDLQLVYDFMKAVDPASVVRESEFATAAKTGNIFQGAFARYNKNFGTGGFLPEAVKEDFTRAARASFEAKNTQYFNLKNEKANQINQRLGITNGADYLTAYEMAAPLTQPDFAIADGLSNATPDELVDIIQRSLTMPGSTTQN